MATLGQAVSYTSSKGHTKLAFVTATPETVTEGHSLPELSTDQVHLFVVSPNGNTYARYSVPLAASVEGNVDFEVDGQLRNVYTTL